MAYAVATQADGWTKMSDWTVVYKNKVQNTQASKPAVSAPKVNLFDFTNLNPVSKFSAPKGSAIWPLNLAVGKSYSPAPVNPTPSVFPSPVPQNTAQQNVDKFTQWLKKQNNPIQDTNYDESWYFAKYGRHPDYANWEHWTDEFKMPNHITFSNESKYSKSWQEWWVWWTDVNWKDTFTPSAFNLKNHSLQEMQDYFKKYEPNSTLILPNQNKNTTNPFANMFSMDNAPAIPDIIPKANANEDTIAKFYNDSSITDDKKKMLSDAIDQWMPRADAENYLNKTFYPDAQTTPTQWQDKGLLDKLWQRANDIGKWFTDLFNTPATDIALNPLWTLAKTAINVAWPIIWWVNDTIWAWVNAVANSPLVKADVWIIKSLTPDFVKNISDNAWKVDKTIWEHILNSKAWQAWLWAIANWMNTYNEWAKANPDDARLLDNTVNVASLVPIGWILKAKWLIWNEAGNVAWWLVKDAITSWEKNLIKKWLSNAEKKTLEIITPKTFTPTERETLIKAWKLKTWQWLTGSKDVFMPWKEEVSIAKSASPHIKVNATVSENVQNLNKAIENEAKTLESKLAAKNPVIPKKEINAHIKQVTAEIFDNPEMVWENKKIAEKLIAKYKAFLDEEWGTGLWALKARKRFDNYVNSFKKWVFNPSTDSVYKTAVRAVRNGANDMVEKYATDIGVKSSLKNQSNLYKAIDMIAGNKDINLLWKIIKSPYTKIWAWIIWGNTAYWLIK